MPASVLNFPPPSRPRFDAQLPPEQKIQVEEGLKQLLRQPGDPVVFRKGHALYLPYADGLGAFRAKRPDIQQFIMSHFEMVDVSVPTKRTPDPQPKYRSIHTSVTAWLEHHCPEFVPELDRVVTMPLFVETQDDEVDDAGQPAAKRLRLICKPGYDVRARIIYDPSSAFKAIDFEKNQFPSTRAAYEYLRYELLADCNVGPEHDPKMIAANEAALLAALVTPALKEIAGLTPGMLFWAQDVSAGKTFFATVIETIYTGRHAPMFNWGSSEQEREWAVAAILMNDPPVVIIDNIKSTIRSSLLDTLLTSDTLRLRAVGETMIPRKNNAMWVITSNNPELDKDAANRFLPIMFRRHSSHDTGQYTHPYMHDYIIKNRHRILGAIYQLIRAGDAWTDPSELQSEVPPSWSKFPYWADKVWHICRAAGLDNFLTQSATDVASAQDEVQVCQLLKAMHTIKAKGWTSMEIIDLINTARLHDPTAFALLPFMKVSGVGGQWVVAFEPQAFGKWVHSFGPMDHGGLKIERYRSNGLNLYRLVTQDSVGSVGK